MNDQGKRDLLTIGDASIYLGVSIDTLRRWEKRGRIVPFRSPGGHRYYERKELDELFGKRYTHDERDESLETNTITEELQAEPIPEPKPILVVEEQPLPAIAEVKPLEIPSFDPIKIPPRIIEPEPAPPIPEPIQPPPPPIEKPKVIEIIEIKPEPIAEKSLAPSPGLLIPQVSLQSPPAVSAPKVETKPKSDKKEMVTTIIIVSILILVVLLGIILFVMLWKSSQNVLSPSP